MSTFKQSRYSSGINRNRQQANLVSSILKVDEVSSLKDILHVTNPLHTIIQQEQVTTTTPNPNFNPKLKKDENNVEFIESTGFKYIKETLQDRLQVIAIEESRLKNQPQHKNLREVLFGRKGFGKPYLFNQTQVQKFSQEGLDNKTPNLSGIRDRGTYFISISFYIWIASWYIATDLQCRNLLLRLSIRGQKCPLLLKELCQKNRISICGDFQVTPVTYTAYNDMFINDFPEFKGTFADLDYLRTEMGMSNFITTFSNIASTNPDYYEVADLGDVISIPVQSGNTTTFGSLSVIPNTRDVQTLQHNAYPYGMPDDVNVVDAVSVDAAHFDDGKRISYSYSTKMRVINNDTDSLLLHLVYRSLGIQSNTSGMSMDNDIPFDNKSKFIKTNTRQKSKPQDNGGTDMTNISKAIVQTQKQLSNVLQILSKLVQGEALMLAPA